MPTYLTHETSPVYASDTDFLDLDQNNALRLSSKRPAHDASIRPSHQAGLRDRSEARPRDSFDESSFSSTHASDASDPAPNQMNGTRPTSRSSLPNGKAAGGDDPHEVDYFTAPNGTDAGHQETYKAQTPATTQQNGFVKMPDRTAPPPPVRAVSDKSSATHRQPADRPSNSQASLDSGTPNLPDSACPSPAVDTASANKGHFESSSSAASVHGSELKPYQSAPGSEVPAAPVAGASSDAMTPEQRSQAVQQNRFSSPAQYGTGATAAAAGSSSLQVPPNTGLKQRHTLEVPKVQTGRISKDGGDAAFASGRFSPTTVRRASLSLARRNTRSMQSDTPRDEIVPDEDAMRWAEAYRQKRASKRKKREEEDDDRVLVGTKVDEHHANWVTAYNMLTGIRVSVSRTNAKIDRPLSDKDFHHKQKSTFDIAGNELVPSAKYDFKFKDYAPWVFRHLRALFRLDPADYLMSLTGKYILSELGSPGKSGSFFYFSRDYKYIIKTIHHAEHKFLRKILKDYYQHVTDNPNTLLSQFYGLHRVKMPYGKKIHFVVMNNLFPPHRDIHTTFDLKGSTIGRDYREEDLEKNPRATLKDLNWLRRQRSLELGLQKKRLFLEQLNRDVELMKKLKIMDYSLLVGIHDMQRGNEENLRGKTLQVFNPGGDATADESEPQSVLLRTPSKLESARKAKELRQMIRHERPVPMGQTAMMPDELDEAHSRAGFIFNQDDGGLRATHEDNSVGDEIYYLGVIDCLTHYGMIKKIEHFWKGLTNDRSQISATPPDQYGDRFYHFVEGITMSEEEAARERQRREQEMAEGVTVDEENERVPSWRTSGSKRRSSSSAIPPMPTHVPPPAPMPSGQKSPEAQETVERARQEAMKAENKGHGEQTVPDLILSTAHAPDKRESTHTGPILPVLEEAAEVHSVGGRSRDGDADDRTHTPHKTTEVGDGGGIQNSAGKSGFGMTDRRDYAPHIPLKMGKPESQDSGYGAMVHGKTNGAPLSRENSKSSIQPRLSKDSLNKDLPPLPGQAGVAERSRAGYT